MTMREITQSDIAELSACLSALADHHNAVSVNFKGCYPARPIADTLASFAAQLAGGTSRIAVIADAETVIGFCKTDMQNGFGNVDYLVVLPEYRGCGYGKMLMDWAMEQFRTNHVDQIEIRVVDGNPAMHFYEKYGFAVKSHILGITKETQHET